jgi:hypothetical protein
MRIDIKKIVPNDKNPRVIKGEKFRKLVKSVQEFPEMLELRPIVVDRNMMVLGGNMRLKACLEAGLQEVPILIADNLTPEQEAEFIIKDNIGFGEWDWDMMANEWDLDDLESWGLDLPNIDDQIDDLEEDEEIELPQSVQLEPPREYILIMADPNSVEWEEMKETLKLGMVRIGGYKKGSTFDAVSLERVIEWKEFKQRMYADRDPK